MPRRLQVDQLVLYLGATVSIALVALTVLSRGLVAYAAAGAAVVLAMVTVGVRQRRMRTSRPAGASTSAVA